MKNCCSILKTQLNDLGNYASQSEIYASRNQTDQLII